MTIEQMVEIPEDRRIVLDLPPDLPVGKARIVVIISPEPLPPGEDIKSLKSLFGIHKGMDTLDAYFERKRADKAKEDAQFERMQSKQ